MIPIKDKNPTRIFPFVNFGLIGINLAVFAYQFSLGAAVEQFLYQYGIIPRNVMLVFSGSSETFQPLLSFVTSMFLHGGWLHLGGNLLYLWIFGDNVEDKLGHGGYLLFYMLCGILASGAHVVIEPTSSIPTVGASGAISGVLAAYLLMFPRARVVTIIPIFIFLQIAELPALVVLGFWFIMQFFNGLASLGFETGGMGGVAWWAHVGGFVTGLILVTPFRKHK